MGARIRNLKRTGERLFRGARRDFRAFSPLPDSAVDFGDYPVVRKFVVSMDLELEILKGSSKEFLGDGAIKRDPRSRAVFPGLASSAEDRRDRSTETARSVPGAGALRQSSLRSRREKSQANHAADIALADTFALANFEHGSRATRDQIVKPAAGARCRLQDCRINPRR